MKIIIAEECGNSPKSIFVKDFTISLAAVNLNFIHERAAEDILWRIIGEDSLEGRDQLVQRLQLGHFSDIMELEILHAFSHGKAGAADGKWTIKGGKQISFCHIYEFSSVKYERISSITSYILPI